MAGQRTFQVPYSHSSVEYLVSVMLWAPAGMQNCRKGITLRHSNFMCPIGGIWKQADNCHQETPFQTHEKATDDSHVHLTDASKAGDQNKQLRHMKNHQKSRPSHPSAGHACPSPPEVMLTQKI